MVFARVSFFGVLSIALVGACGLAGVGARAGSEERAKVPSMTRAAPAARKPAAPQAAHADATLLDEAGRLRHAVTPEAAAAWKRELKSTKPDRDRAAVLHLWIGEYELAGRREPARSDWYFRQAARLAPKNGRVQGWAAIDSAISQFYQGAYREAADEFRHLLAAKTSKGGYDRRTCALWYRHASACAGFHERNAKLGIKQPERLDPLCGAAGLAVCLEQLGLPHDKEAVLSACRVAGMGSTYQDILDACKKLGVSGRVLTADEKGLKLLPMPMVAYVEHDHFVAVTRVDDEGVSYWCSDCGHWPGGEQRVTWKQWRAMEATVYLSVLKPGSQGDRVLAAALDSTTSNKQAGRELPGVRVAASDTGGLKLGSLGQIATLAALLKGHVSAYLPPADLVECGRKLQALHCHPYVACALDGTCGRGGRGAGRGAGAGMGGAGRGGAGGGAAGGMGGAGRGGAGRPFGPSWGDPVNLATGEEEYEPNPDLTVYNAAGPSVAWGRMYNSHRSEGETYQSGDFGVGWSQGYNIWVHDPSVAINPQVPQAGTLTFVSTGTVAPATGLTWDILRAGGTVATSAVPNGWTVSFDPAAGFTVASPAGALSVTGYSVRTSYVYFMGTQYASAPFDVLAPAAVPQGVSASFASTGTLAPAAGLTWQVLQGGVQLGSSAAPGGWTAVFDYSNTGKFIVGAPVAAAPASNYEVRVNVGAPGNRSAPFTVLTNRFIAATGTKQVIFPNGSRIGFTANAVPTASTPVECQSAENGIPMKLMWYFDAANPCGYYAIVSSDGSRMVTTQPAKAIGGAALMYALWRIEDTLGNAISISYGSILTSGGFPVVSTINNGATGAVLLSVARAGDGTGNITGISDAYGRSVYYRVSPYATANIPPQYGYQSYQELDQVSQIVPTGTFGPPLRYAYGYQNVNNGEGTEQVPFLAWIDAPSPTGSGLMARATINYDPLTSLVSSTVDANGNRRTYTAVSSNETKVAVTTAGGSLIYEYRAGFDASMNQTSFSAGPTGAARWTQAFADANNPYGASTFTDGNGRSTLYEWDQFGQLTRITSPRGTVTEITPDLSWALFPRLGSVQTGTKTPTSVTYDTVSGLMQSVSEATPGTTGGSTVTSSMTYDSLGNMLTVTMPGNSTDASIVTTFNYTTDGAYSQTAAVGQPVTATDNLGKTSHFRYDGRGNKILSTDANGNQTDIVYNLANQVTTLTYAATGQTGAGRARTIYTYLYTGGPLTKTSDYDEGNNALPVREVYYTYGTEGERLSVSGSTEPVTYTYSAAYQLKTLKDGKNNVTSYAYSSADRPISVTYPGTDKMTFVAYDFAGNLTKRQDARGVITVYKFLDTGGSLSHVEYPATPAINVTLTYDSYGRRSTMTDGTGSESWAYDDLDNPTTSTTTYTGLAAKSITYSYFADGSRQTMVTPAGTFSYQYDAGQQMNRLTNPYAEVSTWSYRDNGWLNSQVLANGVSTSYTYTQRGALSSLLNRNGGTNLSNFRAMTYDAVMNRTAMDINSFANAAYNGRTTYTNNTKDELTQESSNRNGAYTNNFGYDSAGNSTSFKGATRGYNVNNQDTANVYDLSGNPTTYGGTTLTFDAENRMTAHGTALTAGYTGDHLRAWKQGAVGRTYFLYDGELPVVEVDSTGAVTAVNTVGANGLLSRRSGGTTVFYTFDPQGSVAQRLGTGGTVLSSHTYDAHGAERSGTANPDPFGYEAQWGYYLDSETGLHHLTYRYYSAAAGRFVTRDPIGYAGGENLYAYVGNNVPNAEDPSGLQRQGPIPGSRGGQYRMDLNEAPHPDMHLYWNDGSETVVTHNGGCRAIQLSGTIPSSRSASHGRAAIRRVAAAMDRS